MDDRDDKDGDNEGKETMMIKEYDDTENDKSGKRKGR